MFKGFKLCIRMAMMLIVFAIVLIVFPAKFLAQTMMGNIRGIIHDQSGVVIPVIDVTAHDLKRNNTYSTETSSKGEFKFINLPPGNYRIKIVAPNFKTEILRYVPVELNQTTDLYIRLTNGSPNEVNYYSDDQSKFIQTTTPNLLRAFDDQQAIDLPQISYSGKNSTESAIYNFALLSSNVSGAGSVGVGVGGSVGGQRTRQNNFVLDGIDNNRKDISGPAVYITPEAIGSFTLITDQYSAEFARSTGGQFISRTRYGNNSFHGTAYGFFRNRHLNALDTLQKNAGVVRDENSKLGNLSIPRYDYARYGFNFSGPVYIPAIKHQRKPLFNGRDRLFFFTAFERQQIGLANSPMAFMAPTVEGYAKLDKLSPNLSEANLAILKQYVPAAPTQGKILNKNGSVTPQYIYVGTGTCPCDVNSPFYIPIGPVNLPMPNYSYRDNFVLNLDYIWTEYSQHYGRLIYDRLRETNSGTILPAFRMLNPTSGWLFSYTLNHYLTPKLTSETRIGYRRYDYSIPTPDVTFPIEGFDAFPNLSLRDLGVDIGPNPAAPQSSVENNYQFVENLSYLKGNHSIRFGGDIRKLIAPQVYVPNLRGNYQYNSTNRFLNDLNPDFVSELSVGNPTYYGDQTLLFLYGQNEWRYRPNLTFILGLNYFFQQVPYSARQQNLNSISSVPGLITFDEPKSQKSNFGPRVGVAYSPASTTGISSYIFGSNHQSSIRAGFGMAYDIIVDHLYMISMPPQAQVTINYPSVTNNIPHFLAEGGIPDVVPPIETNPAKTRAITTSWIPDQKVPYSIAWNLTLQRMIRRNWLVEVGYLGTRGVHLPVQNQINVTNRITDSLYLPTYNIKPSESVIESMLLTLKELKQRPSILPQYSNAGFVNPITAFIPGGNSTYHGFSTQLTRRLFNGLLLSSAYTWSHVNDDSTAEVFSTVLSPRRPQNFQNLRDEKSVSMMDRRHRFAIGGIYKLPLFAGSTGTIKQILLGGISFAGTYTFESGEYATVLSGVDSNLNDDSAADRSIINFNGMPGVATGVSPIMKKCPEEIVICPAKYNDARTVGYLANNPAAKYVQAGPGAKATSGRNTLSLPGVNNFDLSVQMNFPVKEKVTFQFRADFINAFNHPQYVPGSPDTVMPILTDRVGGINTATSSTFNKPSQVFSSNPRIIQLSLRGSF